MTKEQLENFINETENKPYFSTLYDLDMWKKDKKDVIDVFERFEAIMKYVGKKKIELRKRIDTLKSEKAKVFLDTMEVFNPKRLELIKDEMDAIAKKLEVICAIEDIGKGVKLFEE